MTVHKWDDIKRRNELGDEHAERDLETRHVVLQSAYTDLITIRRDIQGGWIGATVLAAGTLDACCAARRLLVEQ